MPYQTIKEDTKIIRFPHAGKFVLELPNKEKHTLLITSNNLVLIYEEGKK